jgi:ribonuclease G
VVRDRLGEDVARVVVDDPETLAVLREAAQRSAPHLAGRIELHEGRTPLFKARGVEKDIERATSRTVPLPSGGTLVIDEAEALTAIDVNTGRFTGRGKGTSLAETVLATNLEAVEESARQMRLREVAGVVAIDFIDMDRTRDRVRVMDALESALAQDRAKTRIVALSPSGLVEITRQREGSSLRSALHRPCPYCSGRGVVKTPQTVAIEARRRIREVSRSSEGARRVLVSMHPESACALLEGEGALVSALERECDLQVHVAVDFSLHLEASRLSVVPVAGSPSHESLASRLVPGERISLPAATPLYPADDPSFAVLLGLLVRLEGPGLPIDGSRPSTTREALIEVTSVGRWFATARLAPSE